MPRITDELRAIDLHVGRAIKARREALGMSQDLLGKNVGVTLQQITKYERGVNRVTAGRLAVIAAALGVRVADLFPPLDGSPDVVALPPEVADLTKDRICLLRDTARSLCDIETADAAELED